MNRFNLDSITRPRANALLGLSLDGSRLDGVVLRRTNGGLQRQQSFSVTLSLDPLTSDPELVGREIRNHLDAAGVRERRCVVGLPLKWALILHTQLPKLPEADQASFLQIEAERGFACDVATLLLATSRCQAPSGEAHATLVGIPRNHITLLEQALGRAQLKPVSFSLGLAALQRPEPPGAPTSGPAPTAVPPDGVLALAIGETHVGLQVACGGGVAALRALEGALETEAGQRRLHADLVAREVRITLGQLPAEFRQAIRSVRIFGPRDLAQRLADEIDLRLESTGLNTEVVTAYPPAEFGLELPPATIPSPAFSLAAGHLAGRPARLEFLPPKVTAWQRVSARYSSGKLRMTLTTAGAAALLVGGLFLFQQAQLWHLQAQWAEMKTSVQQLQTIQDNIHLFRPWFDPSLRGLTILKRLTEVFPEDGAVTAHTIEIRDLNTITCTGVARDNLALLGTIKKLRAVPEVSDVNIGQTRGQSPAVQFTFAFHWVEGGSHAN